MVPPQPSPPPPGELPARAVATTEELLRYLGVPGSVTCRDRRADHPPHLWVEIVTSESGLLIGERGGNLRALEYILRLLLREHLAGVCRIFMDVNAYRLRRIEFLKRLARDAARRVTESHHAVTLEPMPAMERRIVHLALTSEALVETSSIGVEPERRVIIRPRDPFLVPSNRKDVLVQPAQTEEKEEVPFSESR